MNLPDWQVPLARREWLRLSAAGVAASSLTGWLPALAARATEAKPALAARAKRIVVLWMDGGPPHTDTFDLKPDIAECGIFKPIDTAVPGIQISELLPQFAKIVDRAAIARSMSTVENEHLRARVHLRTGYRDGQGGVAWPSLGSIASREIGDPAADLPSYVAIAERRDRSHGPGFIGTRHQPLYVMNPAKGVENLAAPVPAEQVAARLALLENLEQGFIRDYRAPISQDHQMVYGRAVQMMRSSKAKAFDISAEPDAVRERYGKNRFGEGCLLARRLLEADVKYIEVGLEGWDTHFENNDQIRKLCGMLDPGMTAFISDLEERGLLSDTLVVWMGEFGRTPKFKGKGRDHFAKAWTTMFMGAGIKGGQVIGRTDATGSTVEDRPVSVPDFLATICQILGIDPATETVLPDGRPVKLVDQNPRPLAELHG
ncbi:MAG: DUF1501 domain-containing protein [Pirellulaceae bacterium]|nr:DUF1501 domain-containing protein [Pirellulaceae bacterium]